MPSVMKAIHHQPQSRLNTTQKKFHVFFYALFLQNYCESFEKIAIYLKKKSYGSQNKMKISLTFGLINKYERSSGKPYPYK